MYGLGLRIEDPLNLTRHVLEGVKRLLNFVAEHRTLDLRQIQAKHVRCGDLRHERLGGGHGHFRTGVRIEHRIGFTRDGCPLRIADGQHFGTLFSGVTQRHQRIHGLTGLRDGHHKRARGKNRVTIAEFVGELHFDRDAHPMFDGVLGHHAGISRRTAGDDDDFVDGLEVMFVNAHLIEVQVAILVETT